MAELNPPGFTKVKYPKYTRPSPLFKTPKTITLWVDSDGILYDTVGDFLFPCNDVPRRILENGDLGPRKLQLGHCLQPTAPIRCGHCGTDRLQVFASGSYETSARCPECRDEVVVHEG